MVIDNLLGLKSSLALGIFFCKGKYTRRKVKKNPLSQIFGIINGLAVTLMPLVPQHLKSISVYNFIQKYVLPPTEEPHNTHVQTRDMESNPDQTTVVWILPALILPALQTHWHFCSTLAFFLGH